MRANVSNRSNGVSGEEFDQLLGRMSRVPDRVHKISHSSRSRTPRCDHRGRQLVREAVEDLAETHAKQSAVHIDFSVAACEALALHPRIRDDEAVGMAVQVEPSTHSAAWTSE